MIDKIQKRLTELESEAETLFKKKVIFQQEIDKAQARLINLSAATLELRKLLEPEKPIPHVDPDPSPTSSESSKKKKSSRSKKNEEIS